MERKDYVLAAFKKAGITHPTDDQIDTACGRLDGLERKYGSQGLTKITKAEMEAEAKAAVDSCVQEEPS